MTPRILSVFGTRPEAVKMAPVVQQLKRTQGVESYVCVTAQHRQMLVQVIELFGIMPDVDLDLMREDQSLSELSAAIFTRLDPVLADLKPDWVLVQGDTTTVAIASLLAYYRHIKVGHVEAGLRTHDKWQPFPEEINRRVAGVTADLHFAPTEITRQAPKAHIIMGAAMDEAYIGKLSVTMIAASQATQRKSATPTNSVILTTTGKATVTTPANGTVHRKHVPANGNGGGVALPNKTVPATAVSAMGSSTPAKTKDAPPSAKQETLPLQTASRGRFDKTEPTLHNGQDLDVPTFIRKGIALSR